MAVTQKDKPSIKLATAADAIVGHVPIGFLYWIGTATVGDDILVSDTSGAVIWEGLADVVNNHQVFPVHAVWDGVVLTTRDSGTLFVILEPGLISHL